MDPADCHVHSLRTRMMTSDSLIPSSSRSTSPVDLNDIAASSRFTCSGATLWPGGPNLAQHTLASLCCRAPPPAIAHYTCTTTSAACRHDNHRHTHIRPTGLDAASAARPSRCHPVAEPQLSWSLGKLRLNV